MAQVTVGVPVYNGAEFLEKCLDCLRSQTFRDIEVLIFDNASDDATGEIAQAYCAMDPRFRYFRHPVNLGPVPNFLAALEAAQSEYFMWRAADDVSDPDYIETLLALLVANPDRDIAVARIVSQLPDGYVQKKHTVTPLINLYGALGRLSQMFFSHHANWIYGVFRREALLPVLREVLVDYPYVWGWDNVLMFTFEFDRKVIGTNTTTFYQYISPAPPSSPSVFSRDPNRDKRLRRDDAKIEMGASFMAFAHRHVDRVIANRPARWFYHMAVAYFGHQRACSWTKIVRRRIGKAFHRQPSFQK